MEDNKQEEAQQEKPQTKIINVPYIDPITGQESVAQAAVVAQVVVLNPFSANPSDKIVLLMPLVEISDPVAFGADCVSAAASYISVYRSIERQNSAPTAPRRPRPQILRAGSGSIPGIRGDGPRPRRRR